MFACTCHKTQAKTMPSLILASTHGAPSGWLYVVLSRTRTLDGLFLMHRLSQHELNRAVSSDGHLRMEITRLQTLHDHTTRQIVGLQQTDRELAQVDTQPPPPPPPPPQEQQARQLVSLRRTAAAARLSPEPSRRVRPCLTNAHAIIQQQTFSWLFVPVILETLGIESTWEISRLPPQGWHHIIEFYRTCFAQHNITCENVHTLTNEEGRNYFDAQQQEQMLGLLPTCLAVLEDYGARVQVAREDNLHQTVLTWIF
jgi:hypothetical protein